MRKFLLFTCILLFTFFQINGEPVIWTFEGETTVPSQIPSGVTASTGFGSGIGSISFPAGDGSTDSYSGNGWSTGAKDLNDYLEFCITNNSGASTTVEHFLFSERRSGTGIRDFDVDYNIDGGVFTNVNTTNVPDNTSWRSHDITTSIVLADGSTLCFRIYGYNAEAGTGTWRFDDVEIQGTAVLPVEYLKFEISKNTLLWTTASEVNNSHFEVERSKDGYHFTKIGEVKGNGNAHHENEYTYTDENPLESLNFYRLKQVDYDGSYHYTKVLMSKNNSFDNIKVLVNHADKSLQVFGLEASSDISLFNSFGQQVLVSTIESGENIDLSSFASGIYVLQFSDNGNNTTRKIFIP
jgi:hypothetical protein